MIDGRYPLGEPFEFQNQMLAGDHERRRAMEGDLDEVGVGDFPDLRHVEEARLLFGDLPGHLNVLPDKLV